jgi:EAL domain-containing protein (putative c-di-GMP-specific phosphodiesterase class I)/AmiR/NasT family two-component response regulator
MARTRTLRIMLAEDEPLLLDALAAFLRGVDGLEIVGCAEDASEAVVVAAESHPDVALVDVRMPMGGGPLATRGIRETSPETRVVALSAYDDRASVLEMVRAGASGFLVKGTSTDDLLDAIFAAARGHGALSAEIAGEVIDELAGQLRRDDVRSEAERARAERIRRVLDGAPLPMAFQPVVDLATASIRGVEALARFDPSDPGHPEDWLADAEHMGVRAELELAAVRAALREVDDFPAGVFLSVNVSPSVAVSPEFGATVPATAARRLVVEVTEHAPVDDYDELNGSLGTLRERGVRVAIDDAGAGFASLRHIVRMAPDFIKLDRTLARDIDADPARRALATALISFAREIGATIVAEGIETESEFRTLRSLGVGLGQGFFLGLPGPLSFDPPQLPD